MTNPEVEIDLAKLEAPIETGVGTYVSLTEGRLDVNISVAKRLTVAKGLIDYYAISSTPATFDDAELGNLTVLAFLPGDGFGDTLTYPPRTLDAMSRRVWKPDILPLAKPNIASQLHFGIASQRMYADVDPVMFANNLAVYGLVSQSEAKASGVQKVGEAGHEEFLALMYGEDEAEPKVTEIAGCREDGESFGDPSAVHNPHQGILQVGAFLAIPETVPESAVAGLKQTLAPALAA